MTDEARPNREALTRHIEQHIGPPEWLATGPASDQVHGDIHVVKPGAGRNYYTLITSGMSDQPRGTSQGPRDRRYAELLICLPPDWPMEPSAWEDERHYWPIRWLKALTRVPPEVTLTKDNFVLPSEGTEFHCAVLRPPTLFGDRFRKRALEDGTLHFLAVVPLYKEEMDFKLHKGARALDGRLEEAGVTELLDVRRPNVCHKAQG